MAKFSVIWNLREPSFEALLSMMQVLESLQYVCYGGLMLSLVILIKLLMLGRKLNFINIMFVNVFFCEVILGFLMIPNFFKVGELNLTEETHLKEQLIGICGKWWEGKCVNKNHNTVLLGGKTIIDTDVWGLTVLEILLFLHSSLIKYIFLRKYFWKNIICSGTHPFLHSLLL